MKRLAIFCFVLSAVFQPAHAVRYEQRDSLRAVELLSAGANLPADSCLMLFYAHQFLGTPYVASTLEGDREEQLVVNLHALDCTTFVETVAALTLTTRHGSRRWEDFLHWLQTLRYEGGRLSGYASRNHYFSQWIVSGDSLGLLHELQAGEDGNRAPFLESRRIELSYMTAHPDAYPALRGNEQMCEQIRQREKAASGTTIRYIPTAQLSREGSLLAAIHDGDVLGMVTRVEGLDVTHLGLAEWGSDGKLHLLHASSREKRVVLDSVTLYDRLRQQASWLGVRVVRVD